MREPPRQDVAVRVDVTHIALCELHPREAIAELVRLRELRRDDNAARAVRIAPQAVGIHHSDASAAELVGVGGLPALRQGDGLAALVDEVPGAGFVAVLIAEGNSGDAIVEVGRVNRVVQARDDHFARRAVGVAGQAGFRIIHRDQPTIGAPVPHRAPLQPGKRARRDVEEALLRQQKALFIQGHVSIAVHQPDAGVLAAEGVAALSADKAVFRLQHPVALPVDHAGAVQVVPFLRVSALRQHPGRRIIPAERACAVKLRRDHPLRVGVDVAIQAILPHGGVQGLLRSSAGQAQQQRRKGDQQLLHRHPPPIGFSPIYTYHRANLFHFLWGKCKKAAPLATSATGNRIFACQYSAGSLSRVTAHG